MANSNQGGSILSFLIIGGILIALLVGGAYFVQRRSVATEPTPTPAVTKPTDESKDTAKKEQTTPPATEDKKVATETPKTEAPKPAPQQQSAPAAELPTTGPAESVSSIIGLGLLAAMTAAYVRSRRSPVTL